MQMICGFEFQNLYIPMTLRTAEGSLTAEPDKVLFEKCFPVSDCPVFAYISLLAFIS